MLSIDVREVNLSSSPPFFERAEEERVEREEEISPTIEERVWLSVQKIFSPSSLFPPLHLQCCFARTHSPKDENCEVPDFSLTPEFIESLRKEFTVQDVLQIFKDKEQTRTLISGSDSHSTTDIEYRILSDGPFLIDN